MKRALNKHHLNQLQQNLDLYQRYLPALDLKRQQLMARQKAVQREINTTKAELDEAIQKIAEEFPWLHNQQIDLSDILTIEHANVVEKTIMGVKTLIAKEGLAEAFSPFNETLRQFDRAEKADPNITESRPYWLPLLYDALKPLLSLKLKLGILEANLVRLQQATKKATQKVNLFSKVMIPEAEDAIRKIKLFLGDQEKAAVIRAKLAKAKQQQKSSSIH